MIEYSDNYLNILGRLWKLKIHEFLPSNTDLNSNTSQSFKYKVALVGKSTGAADRNRFVKNTTVVVPLKYLNKCW